MELDLQDLALLVTGDNHPSDLHVLGSAFLLALNLALWYLHFLHICVGFFLNEGD